MVADFLYGVGYALRGFRLITRPGIKRYVVIPFLINLLLFGAGIWYAGDQFQGFMNRLLPPWLDWLSWLLVPLFAIGLLVVAFYTFTLVANLIGAPFNGLLAERLEEQLAGESPGDQGDGVLAMTGEAIKAIAGEVRKLLYLVIWALPLLLLFLVPGLNVVAPLLWLAFGTWMLSLEYADAPMGNHGLAFKQQRRILGGRKGLALGFGAGIMVMTLIPVLNFLAMPVGVAGATALWVGQLRPPAQASRA